MFLGTLGFSLLGNMLIEKVMLRIGYGSKDLQSTERKGMLRAGYGSKDLYFFKKILFYLIP